MGKSLAESQFVGLGPTHVLPLEEPPSLMQYRSKSLVRLKTFVKEECPKRPGVYGMLDAGGKLIYIGKSKCLRNRVMSYFREHPEEHKVKRLMSRTEAILWEEQPHEFAALLRELQLIRRFRPRFNVKGQPGRLRRVFVCIGRAPAAYLYLSPKPSNKVLNSFGPLPSSWRIREAVRHLNDWFQLRDCSEKQAMFFPEQKQLFDLDLSPGCLRQEINTCLGPCVGACSRGKYSRHVREARAFLAGKDLSVLEKMRQRMEHAAKERQFERAAIWRDSLTLVEWLRAQLDRLDYARSQYEFILPMNDQEGKPLWHLIRSGQVEETIRPPACKRSAQQAYNRVHEVFSRPIARSDPMLYESFDMVILVSQWFDQHPEDLSATLRAEAAQAYCQALLETKSKSNSAKKVSA